MGSSRVVSAGVFAVAVALGVVQLASMAFYGDLARRPAIPALLSPGLGVALARPLGSPWVPAAIRAAYAQALLHRGDAASAAPIVRELPPGGAAAELRGQLAERDGAPGDALVDYVEAGDFERAQALIDERVNAGDVVLAARFEQRLVDVLGGDARAAVRARALWRLGQITQIEAVADPPRRAVLERAALGVYERALAIDPNEETYLLAAGSQALVIGDKARAARFYAHALDVVPDSADARAGLQRARS